ncbi:MAG TPA: UdgX family uracil-DNA binding protein [Terriglobales bacterium]|nr:UdgX family uracil-DNA binding protein [Terriglobales bacterium]
MARASSKTQSAAAAAPGPEPSAWRDAIANGAAELDEAAAAARGCKACELWQRGTQTVFGEGGVQARMMLIGEQPGDQEDRDGKPFVGPAGRLLDRALAAAGVDRGALYVTNVVKHFYWEPRGKWRIHKKPKPQHIHACRPWLEAEIAALRPKVVLCLGATAAQALFGASFRVSRDRGKWIASAIAPRAMATVHPSSLLRMPDDETRRSETRQFTADLKKAWKAAAD